MIRSLFAVLALALMVAAPSARAQDSDSLNWARANSCERIRDYIARYPSGRYLTQARAQLTARNCPAPQTSAPVDPCVQARADWAAIATSNDLPVLRGYRAALPAACATQRLQADARIAEVQRAAQPRPSPQPQTSAQSPRATPPQRSGPLPGAEFDDCNGAGWCPRMIVIPAGEFMMGSPESEAGRDAGEGPQRRVNIRQVAVAKFEVTFDQWAACVSRGGCRDNPNPADNGWGRGARPVMGVSWSDAQQYVRWLSGETGRPYRLLTEAEWEYAARAGTSGPFSNNGGHAALCGIANHADQSATFSWRSTACSDDVSDQTAPVGRYQANGFGLHDMHGNVGEWVQDCSGVYASAPSDGSAYERSGCQQRVIRGGSFHDSADGVRAAARNAFTYDYTRVANYGFRVARSMNVN